MAATRRRAHRHLIALVLLAACVGCCNSQACDTQWSVSLKRLVTINSSAEAVLTGVMHVFGCQLLPSDGLDFSPSVTATLTREPSGETVNTSDVPAEIAHRVAAVNAAGSPTDTLSLSSSASLSTSLSVSASASASSSATITTTPSLSGTASLTTTATLPTPTNTASPSSSATHTLATPTVTASSSVTVTRSSTTSDSPTLRPRPTATPTRSLSLSVVLPNPTATGTLVVPSTQTSTRSATGTATATPPLTATASLSLTLSRTATLTPSPTADANVNATATATATPAWPPNVTATPTGNASDTAGDGTLSATVASLSNASETATAVAAAAATATATATKSLASTDEVCRAVGVVRGCSSVRQTGECPCMPTWTHQGVAYTGCDALATDLNRLAVQAAAEAWAVCRVVVSGGCHDTTSRSGLKVCGSLAVRSVTVSVDSTPPPVGDKKAKKKNSVAIAFAVLFGLILGGVACAFAVKWLCRRQPAAAGHVSFIPTDEKIHYEGLQELLSLGEEEQLDAEMREVNWEGDGQLGEPACSHAPSRKEMLLTFGQSVKKSFM